MTFLILALTLNASLPAEARSVGPLADLVLRDQRGREDSLRNHQGQVVLVEVIDARRLRRLKSWEETLRERVDGFHAMRIADVPRDPPVTHDEVADKLRERVPEDVPVLIDLEGEWARSLELETSQPNILVFDREGRLVSSYRGRLNRFLEEYVVRDLEDLLEAEAP